MDLTAKRVKMNLEELGRQRNAAQKNLEPVRMRRLEYGQRDLALENAADWEIFPGGVWGAPDAHYCFQADFTVPEEMKGAELRMRLETGCTNVWDTNNPQFIVYVDGAMRCAYDSKHQEVVLAEQAEAGKEYDLRLYGYSNAEYPRLFLHWTVVARRPEVEKLYYDLKVPYEIACLLREDDPKRAVILKALDGCVRLLDLREPGGPEFLHSIKTAQDFLDAAYERELHEEGNPVVHSIGHTHIDVAWKWPLRQTREKALRSFLTVLELMKRYPEYRFMSSQPQLYEFVKEDSPETYERIKERIAEGRWEAEGAMWLEADCNLTSGESLVRQLLYGKQFFREEFGIENQEILWLPDVFGYSAALPQILKKSGVNYFMTTKISWNEFNQIPHDTMMWQGIDGTEILTHFITTQDYVTMPEYHPEAGFETTYNGFQTPSQVMGTWQRYQDKELSRDVLTSYGYGDGGGGPTEQMLEESRRMSRGLPGCPQVCQTKAKEFFHLLEKNLEGKEIPRWVGELYLEFHRGTYTSMARNKKSNRQCELLAMEAEGLEVMAETAGCGDPGWQGRMHQAWKVILLNQFHDILPGSSIRDVYEDSKVQYEKVLKDLRDQISETSLRLADVFAPEAGDGLVVWNQLGFERSDLVELEERPEGFCQKTAEGTWLVFAEQAPSKGMKYYGPAKAAEIPFSADEESRLLETPFYRVEWNRNGELVSVFDKEEERELVREGEALNRLLVFEDRPEQYDAWNIDADYEAKFWEWPEPDRIEVVEMGPYRMTLRVKRRFLQSSLCQDIRFYCHTRRIDFVTQADWRESQLLLKAAFPLDIRADEATYEIQFGNVKRPTHRNTSWDQAKFEVCSHKWLDLSETGYGAALLNDSKYGSDALGSTIRLTLLKSGIYPNPAADREEHDFTYSLFPHRGDFREGRVVQEAYALNCPLRALQHRAPGIKEKVSMASVDAENLILETIKTAENGEGTVLRLYECYGKRTRTFVDLNGLQPEKVWLCDCMEQKQSELSLENGRAEILAKPYEILTLLVHK